MRMSCRLTIRHRVDQRFLSFILLPGMDTPTNGEGWVKRTAMTKRMITLVVMVMVVMELGTAAAAVEEPTLPASSSSSSSNAVPSKSGNSK